MKVILYGIKLILSTTIGFASTAADEGFNFSRAMVCLNNATRGQVKLEAWTERGRIAFFHGSGTTQISCITDDDSVECTLPNESKFFISRETFKKFVSHDEHMGYLFSRIDEAGDLDIYECRYTNPSD